MRKPLMLFLLLLVMPAACVTVKPVVLDRKTQLENQVLGLFQRLEDDLVLASSVRGSGSGGLSPLEREAAEAMMLREFIRDDVEALKSAGWVGEGLDGLLALLKKPEEPREAARASRLVAEENGARTALMQRVVQLSPELHEADMPLVRRLFYRLNVQTARPGDLVQREDGSWQTRASE